MSSSNDNVGGGERRGWARAIARLSGGPGYGHAASW